MSEPEELAEDHTDLIPVIGSTWIAAEPHPVYGNKNIVTVMFVTQRFKSASLGVRGPTVVVGGLDCNLGTPVSVAYFAEEFFELYTPLYSPWTVAQDRDETAGAFGAPLDEQ